MTFPRLSVFALCFAVVSLAQDLPAPRNVRISFLPPPLDGTISLGIYDSGGRLVRVLHREAEVAEFELGADALHTAWDGKDDAGQPLPAGKYSARGYVVGDLKVEDAPRPADLTAPPPKLSVKLVANPLAPKKKATVELSAGYDEDGTFLQTSDGLPLFTVDESAGIINAFVTQRPDKSLDCCQNDGDTTDCFHITRVDQMMGFDAGDFELK
ncbi:MAG: hypothetical protein ACJ8KU_11080 [Chthoniobacterales bacterium]